MAIDEKNPIELFKAKAILKPIKSKEELRNWLTVYFGLEFPMGVVCETSTHGPLDAMWRIYYLFDSGRSAEVSQVVMLASRDSYKTLAASALECLVLIMLKISVAHGAAIKSQSEKAVQYMNSFFRRVSPYLEYNGWKKISDSKTKIEWITKEGESIYVRVLVATLAGMNCVHPDSKLITKDGEKTASEVYSLVKHGRDVKLLSFNHKKGIREFKSVVSQEKKEHETQYTITTEKGSSTTSGEHEFFINGEYKEMKNIKVGDEVGS